ncbi:intraflagellar transport protein 22 homolog isoform X2 [Homalodisca vitripennis]|uniref:intraflagellar transport protein 22 homolog isoform X2 n=1 Tax=Homalodisca vitripennis TaxID=197043 RepID=UPI001EEA6ABF|nr:intraflagellar transport protein 22 homolog isoform X2 [Homalodisca vitripennis]
MFHLKIVLIGPCKSGKTTIANFLSDSTENVGGEYRPTQGVRIVEFETQNSNINNGGFKTDVELWDCSGDLKFESFWPAIYKDANGIVFVCDLSVPDASSKLDYYFESFVNQNSLLSSKNCLLIENVKNNEIRVSSLSNVFSKMQHISINGEENIQKLGEKFNKYISTLLSGVRDRSEQDELNILTIS